MLWLIPMAGRGLRTQPLGEFKPFIEIRGYKIIHWLLFSFKPNIKNQDKFIFVTTSYFFEKFAVRKELEFIFKSLGLKNKFEILISENFLAGNSCSIYLAKEWLEREGPVSIACCDQFTDFLLPSEILPQTGYLTLGLDFGTNKGYVEIEEGLIKKFAEKEPISNLASSGIFIVSEGKALVTALERQFQEKAISTNREYCIGQAFNYLIKDGFKIYPLLPKAHYSLGSIPAINYFASSTIADSISKFWSEKNVLV